MQTIVVILVAFVREIVLSRATAQLENIAVPPENPDSLGWVVLSSLLIP
jgi:hypothetical protein